MADKGYLALLAHLMRRAGFGATPDELDAMADRPYEDIVEDLLHPENEEPVDAYKLLRYHPWAWKPGTNSNPGGTQWLYHMVTTRRPLEEKVTLLWHHVFATGNSKVDHWDEVADMIDLFREKGLGKFSDLLIEVAKNPAMLYWLDNNENQSYALNENWGRELLELFTMGIGAYTEDDVKECSRAFTGWTIKHKLPRFPYGRFDWRFRYVPEDHDDGEKSFLGYEGRLDGEDIIKIVCRQPATARFVSRHLYNFFVADEAQVPAWTIEPPRDPNAIDTLSAAFIESDGDMQHVLRVLFNSDFFKAARFARIKNPIEVVVGTLRAVGGAEFPIHGYGELARQPGYLGQELLNPPSVEGWHTGQEWINSAALAGRVNFMAEMFSDLERPGVKAIIQRLKHSGQLSPEGLVDAVLELLGAMEVPEATRTSLVEHATEQGPIVWKDEEESITRVSEILQLAVSTRDFQFA